MDWVLGLLASIPSLVGKGSFPPLPSSGKGAGLVVVGSWGGVVFLLLPGPSPSFFPPTHPPTLFLW